MVDYSRVVVEKPWGSEKAIYQSPEVEVWLLYIKKGQKTSLHSHPNKKTSLCVLGGAVKTSFLTGNPITLLPSEKINIHPKVFHQTECWSSEGAWVIEMESPPDKNNLVRIRDKYGRVGQGYETTTQVREDFSDNIELNRPIKIGDCQLELTQPENTFIDWKNGNTTFIGDLRYLDQYKSLFILEGAINCGDFPVIEKGDATDPNVLRQLVEEFGYNTLKILGIKRC